MPSLRKENCELCKTVESFQMSTKIFELDKNKLKFYTRLESIYALTAVFNLVAPAIEKHHLSSLSKFNQFTCILVIMKLRLNLPDQDLGYRFGVSQSTVSKIWIKMINIMYIHLKSFIVWPEREQQERHCR